jgi:hypothetical protein
MVLVVVLVDRDDGNIKALKSTPSHLSPPLTSHMIDVVCNSSRVATPLNSLLTEASLLPTAGHLVDAVRVLSSYLSINISNALRL